MLLPNEYCWFVQSFDISRTPKAGVVVWWNGRIMGNFRDGKNSAWVVEALNIGGRVRFTVITYSLSSRSGGLLVSSVPDEEKNPAAVVVVVVCTIGAVGGPQFQEAIGATGSFGKLSMPEAGGVLGASAPKIVLMNSKNSLSSSSSFFFLLSSNYQPQ
jgi:hypothetical protein